MHAFITAGASQLETTLRNILLPATFWDPGIKFRWSGLLAHKYLFPLSYFVSPCFCFGSILSFSEKKALKGVGLICAQVSERGN